MALFYIVFMKNISIFVLLLINQVAFASTPPANSVYLPANAVDPVKLLPGPPAPDSKEWKEDFAVLEHYQAVRTQAECDRAASETDYPNFITFYQAPRGPLSATEVKRIASFFNDVMSDEGVYIGLAKNHWNRPRPYDTDLKLEPCIHREKSKAYPSGHATTAQVFGRILSDIFSDRKKAIMARSAQIGEDRLIGGVHHPSDVRDAFIYGDALYDVFKTNEAFQAKVKALKE